MMQLEMISRVCGTPAPGVWPNVVNLPLWGTLRPKRFHKPAALNLLDRMLELDPDRRVTADDALKSPWLRAVVPDQYVPHTLRLTIQLIYYCLWTPKINNLS
jgi:cyclin-dependent kinase 12/13